MRERSAQMRIFVHLDFGRGLEAWTRRYDGGLVWDSTPYGYGLASRYCDISFSRDYRTCPPLFFVQRAIRKMLGFDVVHAARNFSQALRSDAIWTHTEQEHLAMAALLSFVPRKIRPKLIAQSIWLWDDWKHLPRTRRVLYGFLLRVADVHTVHSPMNREIATKVLRSEAVLVPYGASGPHGSSARRADLGEGLRIVAVGNDRDRNWSVLIKAAENLPNSQLIILTSHRPQGRIPPNVEVRGATDVKDVSRMLSWADVVAVPIRHNSHASGNTAVIEAIHAEKPVVVSDTGGLRMIFGSENLTYVREESPTGWAQDLFEAARFAQTTSFQWLEERGLTARDFALRHVLLTRSIISQRRHDERVSALRGIGSIGSDGTGE